MNSLTIAEQREAGSLQREGGAPAQPDWNSNLNQPSLGYNPHQYAAQDSGPDLAVEFMRFQRTNPQPAAALATDLASPLNLSPLAATSFSGFEMLAGPADERLQTERILTSSPSKLNFGSPFGSVTLPPAFGSRISGPTVKTQDGRSAENDGEINLANESFSFSA